VNQLTVSAWFPVLLLLWEARNRHPRRALMGLVVVLALGLLAGHTQSSYISMCGLGLYAAASAAMPQPGKRADSRLLQAAWHLALVALLGAGLAALQLLPTLELSRLSIRGGGLTYRETVAFSLKPAPRLLWHAFLPPWGRNLADVFGGAFYTEFLAYVGLVPLALAGWATVAALLRIAHTRGRPGVQDRRTRFSLRLLLLAGAGVFLALGLYNPFYWVLYKVVPGFGLFRVPARWMLLYAFAVAMLSAVGAQIVAQWVRARLGHTARRVAVALVLLLGVLDLVIAAQELPLHHPTAPEAYTTLRTAPAHILAAQAEEPAPGRFLSMSDISFDPGDLGEIQHMFARSLSERQIYDYVVCVKRQEILAPNLPLAWHAYAVDGYDGGVLPLARYVALQRLFIEENAILTDGRMREGLQEIPNSRLLSLVNAPYVITDKVHDVWIDDIFYDLAFDVPLQADASIPGTGRFSTTAGAAHGEASPAFAATAAGIVSYLKGARHVADGTPVAEVRLIAEDGSRRIHVLRAGTDTAEGAYAGDVAHAQARVGRAWRDGTGSDYVTLVRWDVPYPISQVEVRALPFEGQIHIRGVTLIDVRDGSSVPVIVTAQGRFRQVHSGDVKVYQALDVVPRAHIVHVTEVIDDDDLTLQAMADPAFDPAERAILAAGWALDPGGRSPTGSAGDSVQVRTYAPEEIVVETRSDETGYLVLSDAWYPGWRATVDGVPARIERANLAFRAVFLPKGSHIVRFVYRPISFYAGLGISGLTLASLLGAAFWGIRKRMYNKAGQTETEVDR